MDNRTLLNQLRGLILSKNNHQAIDPDKSKTISEEIFYLTNNYVSTATVQRFFEIQEMGALPSRFVLNAMCQYIGYLDWNDFVKYTSQSSKS
ncbi:hypothetical protein [Pedobacter aquatilis]|uniref:hypothetical protein n=1 Tax=Pedobacter aquatilis TaxID=351343 RepID=UPI00292CBF20|nr:hypothetical protein [Pedobacter aquatilis]